MMTGNKGKMSSKLMSVMMRNMGKSKPKPSRKKLKDMANKEKLIMQDEM